MQEALEEGWLLEAITLQESIISDRLISILGSKKIKANSSQSLSDLIAMVSKALTRNGKPEADSLFGDLNNWRICRNKAVHGFCKADEYSSDPTSIEAFSKELLATAEMGNNLAEQIRDLANEVKKMHSETRP